MLNPDNNAAVITPADIPSGVVMWGFAWEK